MKPTLWSILVSAAAVFPALHGVNQAGAVPAGVPSPDPVAERPAPIALEATKERADEQAANALREQDEVDDAPVSAVPEGFALTEHADGRPPAALGAVPRSPDATPLSKRSLGRPRTRAPDAGR